MLCLDCFFFFFPPDRTQTEPSLHPHQWLHTPMCWIGGQRSSHAVMLIWLSLDSLDKLFCKTFFYIKKSMLIGCLCTNHHPHGLLDRGSCPAGVFSNAENVSTAVAASMRQNHQRLILQVTASYSWTRNPGNNGNTAISPWINKTAVSIWWLY